MKIKILKSILFGVCLINFFSSRLIWAEQYRNYSPWATIEINNTPVIMSKENLLDKDCRTNNKSSSACQQQPLNANNPTFPLDDKKEVKKEKKSIKKTAHQHQPCETYKYLPICRRLAEEMDIE